MHRYDPKRRSRVLLAAALSSALVLVTAGSVGAAPEPCRVKNTDSGQRHSRLQPAVTNATAGDRIEVRGTCRGSTTVDRDLVIKGVWTRAWGRARLQAGAVGGYAVTVVPGITVTLKSLALLGGQPDADDNAGGLRNRGLTTLKSVHVRGQGYKAVLNESSLTIQGESSIDDGVWNEGELTIGGLSSVEGGRRGSSSQTGVYNYGSLTLNGRSSIVDYRWDGVSNSGTVILNDESRILRNRKVGIFNRGTVVMNDRARVAHNHGTGIIVQRRGALTMNGGSWISHNEAARGAGVFLRSGTLTMNDGSRIRYNKARVEGGGLYVGDGTLVGVRCGKAADANVRNNKPQDCVFE